MKCGPSREQPSRLRGGDLAMRWFVVLALPATLVGLFVWCAGWFSTRLSAPRIVDAFEATSTPHPGFRRNHAKGICVSGYFDSDGAGVPLSDASVFARGRYPVIGRLSMPGSDPGEDDNEGMIRSFALRIALPHGAEWRLAMNSAPIFAVRTPQALFDQLKASERDPQTGRANHAKMQAFLAGHPELQAFRRYLDQHPPSSRYDNATYYGISSFKVTDARGAQRFVRWDVVPENAYSPVDASAQRDPDFLAYDLLMQLAKHPLRWHLMLNVALSGDTVDDSTRQWAASRSRPRIDAGTFVIDHAQSQIDGPCRDIVFDPLVLPEGIAPSSDPLLAARSSAYRVSLDRRLREEAAAHTSAH